MDKRQLIAYLDAVCSAENAVYMCREAITSLRNQANRVGPGMEEPKLNSPASKPAESSGSGCGGGCLGVVVAVIVIALTNISASPVSLVVLLIGFFGGMAFSQNSKTQEQDKAKEREQQAAQADYDQRMQIYERAVAASKLVKAQYASLIRENEARLQRLQLQLDRLYAKGIIYSSFRNHVAVYQIREYLAMGVCNTLEGPTGAYAVYMEDVRTNRICGSIDKLRDQLARSMSEISMTQGKIVQELKQTRSSIDIMNRDIGNKMNSISSQIRAAALSSENQSRIINANMNELNRTLKSASYNQYLMLCENNVNRYLQEHPYR